MNDAVRGDSVCHSAAGTAQTTAEFLTRFQTFPERYHLRSAPIALCERDTADAAALQEVFLVFFIRVTKHLPLSFRFQRTRLRSQKI